MRKRTNTQVFEMLEGRRMLSGGTGGGGGGAGTTTTLTPPAIAPGTFDGIGPGPTYIRESFGIGQGSRYKQNGSLKAVNVHTNINGIRAEFPNNSTETWIAPPEVIGGQEWDFSVTGPADPYEAYTPLQEAPWGYSDGTLSINGANPPSGADLRPNALLPFAAPTNAAYRVSADAINFYAKTAIGFSNSGATNMNFEKNGQAWLEIDTTNPANNTFVFHTNGTSGASVSGTFNLDANSFNQMVVSYDPVNHIAAASLNGNVIAQIPFSAAPIKYVGVEGSWYATVDNFQVQTGAVQPPAAAAPTTSLFSSTSVARDPLLGSSTTPVI